MPIKRLLACKSMRDSKFIMGNNVIFTYFCKLLILNGLSIEFFRHFYETTPSQKISYFHLKTS
jgi:hypothetical protein